MATVSNSRVLCVIPLLIAVCLVSFPAQAKYGGGTGEPNEPFQIATAEDLMLLGESPEDYDKHFILTADIDLLAYTGTGFNIIGTDERPFTGVFDGNNHTISNFFCAAEIDYVGIFGYINHPNAHISNLFIIDPNVDSETGSYLGSLAGWFGEGTITNCHAKGGCISGGSYVGGLVGNQGATYTSSYFPFSLMIECSSTTDVSGSYAVGGLAGYIRPDSRMTDCYATGGVFGTDRSSDLGGLVGHNNLGTIERCYATGNVSAGNSNGNLGGLVGSYINGSISGCYATGRISGGENSERLGGLVGDIFIGTIDNCYATGNVSGGANSRCLGGLVGYQASNGTLDSCFATGHVHGGEGTEDIGGLVGYFTGSIGYAIYGFTMRSFWDMEASGIQTSNGGMGLTTDQMVNSDTYSLNGWASNRNWIIDSGKDYPRLAWEGRPGQAIPEPSIDWFEGGGTEEDPYIIATDDQLALLGTASVLWDKCFVIVSDLDLTGKDLSRIGICNGMEFTGDVDGKGHVINNLTLGSNKISVLSLGLFGLVGQGGHISNLGLENVTILGGDDSERLGGLAGENRGIVTHCYAIGSISGGERSRRLGGLVGYNRRGTLTHCYATGGITGGNAIRFLGGLVGDNSGTIISCYADSTVTGGYDSRCIGGLVGLNPGDVTHCYATGTVVGGHSSRSIGGLIGAILQGTVTKCYAAASASGGHESIECGGLAGDYWEEAMIINSYFLAPSDGGGPDNGSGLALTEGQMGQQTSFVGWDFVGLTDGLNDIWAVPVGGGYPILWWQLSPLPASPFSDGTGESNDPFLISTADELGRISNNPRFMTAHFSLTNDIDLTGVNFFVIGSELYPFSGVFKGNGHKISNLKYSSTDANNVGLFGYVEGRKSEIKDLVLIDPNVEAGNGRSVGSLVGTNCGTINNCHVHNGSVAGYSSVGVLVGGNSWFSEGIGRLIKCSATGTVSSESSAGGLVGDNYGTIIDSYSICNVSGSGWVGGLVDYNYGTISRCYAGGNVSGDVMIGGLVAYNQDTVNECFATAAVSGTIDVGGLMGTNEGTITDCYSTGSVLGDRHVGGLVGCSGQMYNFFIPCQVVNCYSTGSVSGNMDVGGLVGYNCGYDSIVASFWDMETSGQSSSAGGTGKTTTDMQSTSTFVEVGWDFVNETENGTKDIWWILEGQDYPRLWWEAAEQ